MRTAEFIIIGGGPGGYAAATELAAAGRKVILIERDQLATRGLNRNCIATKCLTSAAAAAMSVSNASKFGIEVSLSTTDYSKVIGRTQDVIDGLSRNAELQLRDFEIIRGEAALKPDKVVKVNGEELTADYIIIATGSTPAVLDVPGASLAVTSDQFLQLKETPQRVAVIGGGATGLEFASALAALGREVTVIEAGEEVLSYFDREIAKHLQTALSSRGVRFITSAKVVAIEHGLRIIYKGAEGKASLECDLAVTAIGRRPVLPSGTKEAGIELDERGFIKVDELMETSVRGIFAVGDVNGLCMLANAAAAQARRAIGSDVNLDIIPAALSTLPEAAKVGMTEDQARAKDYKVMIGKADFYDSVAAIAMGQAAGMVKIIFARDSGFILGCQIVGPRAADLIAEAAALMFGMTTHEELADELVHCHPTLSETIQQAARDAK